MDPKPKVMIIDENAGTRAFYATELAESGYDVFAVGDVAAFEKAFGGAKPDLIILDPWIGGRYRWDVVSGIKERDSSMPVLLCLAFDAPLPFEAPFPRDLATESLVLKSMWTEDLLLKVERITKAPQRVAQKAGGRTWMRSRR